MNKLKDFKFYHDLCKIHKTRVEKLIATTHMHLLMESFKTLFFKNRFGPISDEIKELAETYKISEIAVVEIFILGRFMENIAYWEGMKNRANMHFN